MARKPHKAASIERNQEEGGPVRSSPPRSDAPSAALVLRESGLLAIGILRCPRDQLSQSCSDLASPYLAADQVWALKILALAE